MYTEILTVIHKNTSTFTAQSLAEKIAYDFLSECRDNDIFHWYVMLHTTGDAVAESPNGSISRICNPKSFCTICSLMIPYARNRTPRLLPTPYWSPPLLQLQHSASRQHVPVSSREPPWSCHAWLASLPSKYAHVASPP